MPSFQLAALGRKHDHLQDVTYKGLRATRNVVTDQSNMLRDMQFGITNIKTLLVDAKAVSHTLPHAELKNYVPFKTDQDVITVLSDTNLTNALYAKVKDSIYALNRPSSN